jgi:type IV secretion system protein TrbL
VERYFALAVSSGVKLMVLYLLAGGGWVLTNGWVTQAQSPLFSQASVESAWIIGCGCVLYAGICWHAPSMVASILGGSPNLSHSDFIAFAAPAIGGAVTAGLIAAGFATGGAGAAAAAGTGAVSAGASAGGGANPSGGITPQPSPGGASANGSGGQGARMAAAMAQVGATAVSRMPHAGNHGAPPHFSGFGH